MTTSTIELPVVRKFTRLTREELRVMLHRPDVDMARVDFQNGVLNVTVVGFVLVELSSFAPSCPDVIYTADDGFEKPPTPAALTATFHHLRVALGHARELDGRNYLPPNRLVAGLEGTSIRFWNLINAHPAAA